MIAIEYLSIAIAILLLASVIASKAAIHLGVPSLLLFLMIGIVTGSEGIGAIEYNNPELTRTIGDMALTIILFSGGLDTKWAKIRPVLIPGLTLATVGVGLTTLLLGIFAWFMLGSFSTFNIGVRGINLTEGLLLGAIISSTDAAAVFSILRSGNLGLRGNLQPLLEFESGSNDPMAALLTIEIVQILEQGQFSLWSLILSVIMQMLMGLAMGYGLGKGTVWAIRSMNLTAEGLYSVMTLALTLLTYGLSTVVGGNGFLAAYIAGLVVGNSHLPSAGKNIFSFYEALAWLMQIIMFLNLGLLVIPSQLIPIAAVGIAMGLFLIFVARPIATLSCLSLVKMPIKEKLFVSWVGLRGAVPIVLATFPLTAGIQGANQIFHVIFFMVIVSLLVQGLSLSPLAKKLDLMAESEN
ncbi:MULTISPECIES: potassium/proton antiporter [Limnospira]|uniref:potassium/proton antiporter n=1 Tax=Limnospira TaxID=2596745 RepID=UPI0002804494|nr:sodium/hydrogen exchanger [Arthrospira platensis C1]QJB28616.1 potassium/proton antiporter [Limnospira fusiformis SAG 85.79]UWU51257.1 potassium/proton antiporter, CPA1 family [Arthrospira platensis C1]